MIPLFGARTATRPCCGVVALRWSDEPRPENAPDRPGRFARADSASVPRGGRHGARDERKNPEDFASSLTAGRERFDREVQRLRAYSFRAIIVEADLDYFISGRCRSRIHVNSILGSICSMHARYGVPTIFAHDPATAGRMIAGILRRLEEQLDAAEVAA
jgi:hypothetical protein